MAKSGMLTVEDFLGSGNAEYTWEVPSQQKQVRLRRLLHGEVKQFQQDSREAGFRVTDEMKDRMIAAALVTPAMTVAELEQAQGNMRAALDEIYFQAAVECGFLVVTTSADKPTVYVPGELHPDDAALLDAQFTVVREARPAAESGDADPLSPTASTSGMSS